MKILVGIPVLYNGETCLRAFSVVDEPNVDLLIIDNGSEPDVKYSIELTKNAYDNVKVIVHSKNTYVNPAWNEILAYFLNNEKYDQLIIMNSDLIMHPGWSNYLEDGIVNLPCDGTLSKDEEVFVGSPGIFLHLNKKMAKMIYPIPSEIKLWFGDEYILTILREMGIKTIVRHKLIGTHFHGGSQSIAILPNKSEMIEDDKIAWEKIVEPFMKNKIQELKTQKNIKFV